MSAITATRPHRPPTRLNFFRLLLAEWIKLTSLRSSVALLLCTVLGMTSVAGVAAFGIGYILSQGTSSTAEAGPAALALPTSGLVIAQLLFGLLAVIQVGSEYGTGMIRASLTASPRRISNVLAKTVVTAATAFAVGTAGGFVSYLVTQPLLSGHALTYSLDTEGVLPSIINAGASLSLMAVMAGGIGYVLRSSAAGITVTLGTLLVLPILASIIGMFYTWVAEFSRYLPSNAAMAMVSLTSGGKDLTQEQGAQVLLAWAAVTLLIGLFTVRTRDV